MTNEGLVGDKRGTSISITYPIVDEQVAQDFTAEGTYSVGAKRQQGGSVSANYQVVCQLTVGTASPVAKTATLDTSLSPATWSAGYALSLEPGNDTFSATLTASLQQSADGIIWTTLNGAEVSFTLCGPDVTPGGGGTPAKR